MIAGLSAKNSAAGASLLSLAMHPLMATADEEGGRPLTARQPQARVALRGGAHSDRRRLPRWAGVARVRVLVASCHHHVDAALCHRPYRFVKLQLHLACGREGSHGWGLVSPAFFVRMERKEMGQQRACETRAWWEGERQRRQHSAPPRDMLMMAGRCACCLSQSSARSTSETARQAGRQGCSGAGRKEGGRTAADLSPPSWASEEHAPVLQQLHGSASSCHPGTCAVALAVKDAHGAQLDVLGHTVGQAADHTRHVGAVTLTVYGG